ncbi:hypothetical protein AXX12_00510 [Anaerosporomusa subterranea]|jgi:hypothetical protein|uniref:Uncharacterized protein n=1 Tax=Anaerosporomusa subterranea TaxID=1794912 RepID=A0A154BVL2_ANASB|nr:hypothetical protein [Anaerosporomusa subterranea]KYZ78063.1 hypothetical protein AXX12_00510 [Anaerosporomusa subterranea]MDF2500176.1 hypothetical protein [Anaerosporomusa subterranea]
MTIPKAGPWRAVKQEHGFYAVHFEEDKQEGPFANRKTADEFVDAANSALADKEVDFRQDVLQSED